MRLDSKFAVSITRDSNTLGNFLREGSTDRFQIFADDPAKVRLAVGTAN